MGLATITFKVEPTGIGLKSDMPIIEKLVFEILRRGKQGKNEYCYGK
jgi:hypothetical protein